MALRQESGSVRGAACPGAKGSVIKMNRKVHPLVLAALIVSVLLSVSSPSLAEVALGISVRVGPPALPVYAQPVCPGPGYLWTPGYWAWNDEAGYYWVPGTWVVGPVGMLWTPGYWGWGGGFYVWHAGYWGPHVGFYGGINYGYGYGGVGFAGGEWRGGSFYYNRSVTNVNVTHVTNVYNKTVIVHHTTVNNVSYNGGTGGVGARPTPREQTAEREQHQTALAAQTQHEQAARQNHHLFASENHGRPAIAATAKPGEFSGHNVVAAKAAGAPYRAPAMTPHEARGPSTNLNRPGSAPNGKESANSNNGFRKFGPPSKNGTANNTRSSNANDNWRGNNPHPTGPRAASQPAALSNSSHAQSQPHSSAPPPQNAPKRPSSPPEPREKR